MYISIYKLCIDCDDLEDDLLTGIMAYYVYDPPREHVREYFTERKML